MKPSSRREINVDHLHKSNLSKKKINMQYHNETMDWFVTLRNFIGRQDNHLPELN